MEHTFTEVFRRHSDRPWIRFLGGEDQNSVPDLIARQRELCRQVISGTLSDAEFIPEFSAIQKPQLFWSGRFAAISTVLVHKWISTFVILLQHRLEIHEWELPSYFTLQLYPTGTLMHYQLSLFCRNKEQLDRISSALADAFALLPV